MFLLLPLELFFSSRLFSAIRWFGPVTIVCACVCVSGGMGLYTASGYVPPGAWFLSPPPQVLTAAYHKTAGFSQLCFLVLLNLACFSFQIEQSENKSFVFIFGENVGPELIPPLSSTREVEWCSRRAYRWYRSVRMRGASLRLAS